MTRDPLEMADLAVLDRVFQPIVNFFGWSNYVLARACLWLCMTAYAAEVLFYTRDLSSAALAILFSFCGLGMLYVWEQEDKKSSAGGFVALNGRRQFLPYGLVRLVLLVAGFYLVWDYWRQPKDGGWLLLVCIWSAISAFYFSACSKPPPHKVSVFATNTP